MKLEKKEIAWRLFEYRKKRGLTMDEVGNYIGLTRQSLFNYEKGKVVPPFEIIEKLAEIYGTTSFALLYGIEEPKQEAREEKEETREEPTEIIEEATPEKQEKPTEEENEDTEEIKNLKSAKLFAYLLNNPHKIDALIKLLEL